MSSVHFAPSTRFQTAERRSLLSPPPKPRRARSDVDPSIPPVPPLPLEFRVLQPQSQCRLVRGQPQVKPRNRDRRPEYRPLIDDLYPKDDDIDTTPGPGFGAGEFKVD
ncbi:hypothetical protein TRAPUB_3283 [Trametes pubescens]|uniref:Uncharacterized protein n=1 Tax=Trametes pubescens TaxID=154538 RepID=A0A1M2VE57_TRAPU|nr:hypothetical protein TRAPUB_3283 [Trametes pubescens]